MKCEYYSLELLSSLQLKLVGLALPDLLLFALKMQVWFRLFGCHKPDMEPNVWWDSPFHFGVIMSTSYSSSYNLSFAFPPHFLFADLVNVFEVFLPQLLLYPNPSDPLNGEAAALMMRDRPAYEQKVKGNVIQQNPWLFLPFCYILYTYGVWTHTRVLSCNLALLCTKSAWKFWLSFIMLARVSQLRTSLKPNMFKLYCNINND